MSLALIASAALIASCGGGGGDGTDTAGASGAQTADSKRAVKPRGTGSTTTTTTTTTTTSGTTSGTTTTATTSPSTSANAPLGVNLEPLSDWARLQVFVDLVKTSRKWGSAAAPWDESAATDANGWPTGDAGLMVRTDSKDPGDTDDSYIYLTPGIYHLAFTGRATVTAVASPNVSIANLKYDSATNKSQADVSVGNGAYQLALSFTGTSGGVREVTLRRPGYADTDVFTTEFKQALAPFGTLRFMDYLHTNGNVVKKWSERTTPASASQASDKGGSYEYAIQMANELGKDIWLNIPGGADDDYIRSLATLLNTSLAPGRAVYLEYSNEVWNWAFQQSQDNLNAAITEVVAGDKSLVDGATCTYDQMQNGPDPCNKYWAAYKRIGKRAARISQIFSEVMGASAFGTRFRPVLATQWSYLAVGEQQLKYVNKYIGAPKTLFYGVAGAPYYGLTSLDLMTAQQTDPTLSVDQLIQGLQTYVTSYYPAFKANMVYNGGDGTGATQKSLADYYGIKSIAYEGGQDFGQSDVNATNKALANKDPRIASLQADYWGQWFGCGNDLFLQFNIASHWDRYGYWGLTNDPRNLTGPKYASAKQIAQTPRSNFTTCR